MSGSGRKALYSSEATTLNRRVQGQFCQRYAGNPFLTMSDSHQIKTDLRKSVRQRRNSLSAPQQQTAAKRLVDSVVKLPTWASAKHIAIYLANDGEINTEPLNTIARSLGKQIYLPKITDNDTLEFAHWETGAELGKNRYNIPEPPLTAQHYPVSQLDIVFLPLVGWDLFGCRLGMGGGFYDRALANIVGPLLVGLAHECQQVENIPQDSWDLVVTFIATDAALHRCREKPRRL
jgi:5-formyltetrahydrofolate cyclo-ligase